MKIIQLVNGYSKGDGVGNVITAIDTLLKNKGYETEIFNQTLNIADINNQDFQGDNIVLYHVALSVDPLVSYLQCKKILVFHNITDPELLIGPSLQKMRTWCSAGLYDVQSLAKYFDSAIVFSGFSKQTLIKSGWNESKIYQMPIMVRFDNLAQECDEQIVKKYTDEYTNIIFTGRIFPNKKQEDIIHAFFEYKRKYNKKSRLFIVGSVGNANYFEGLKELVQELELENDVVFTGRAPFSQYLAYYKIADVFLCMSAHEGFCIPLVEALYFNVPIVAVNSTAIPDTLCGSGVLLNEREPRIVASAINHLLSDKNYRSQILESEKVRLAELQPSVIEELYVKVLSNCISSSSTENQYKEFDLHRVVSDSITVPQKLYEEKNVIYGFGAAGNRLWNHLRNQNINVTCVCDKNKGGTKERNINILILEEVLQQYKNVNYIISIQDKKIIKNVICMLINAGINGENIFVFDEINDEIV